jgi:hypothetical protein
MSKAKTPAAQAASSRALTTEPQDDKVLPPWFDPAKHSAGDGGIFETATGTLLAEDGEPLSEALRIQRKAAADAVAAAEAAKAADVETEAGSEAGTAPAAELPHHSV